MPQITRTGEDNIGDRPIPKKRRRFWPSLLIASGIVLLLIFLLLPMVRTARPTAYRTQCSNNLKHIAVALSLYADVYHAFPPAHTLDAEGRPLHSWRTLILPYMEQQHLYAEGIDLAKLYEKIDLSKPWNDAANAEAYKAIVPIFHCPSASCPKDHTTYLASVGSHSCFDTTAPRPLDQIIDGLSNTLMVIEVAPAHAVHWMSPVDADVATVMSVGQSSTLAHQGGINALFCDGSVRFLPADTAADVRRALISIDGNDNELLKMD